MAGESTRGVLAPRDFNITHGEIVLEMTASYVESQDIRTALRNVLDKQNL